MTTILILEDDNSIHSLIKEALELDGYRTLSAYSGTEGNLLFEQKFEQEPIDLFLLDLMLPGMEGEEFLREIRQNSTVPIIVISAKNDQHSKLELLTNGADDYITKPFDVKELLARISIQLRHATNSVNNKKEFHYKNIKVNLDTREIEIDGQVLNLTRREYEILLLFLKNPQKVFSRSNIFESVWNGLYFNNDNTINMHISNLRNKLKHEETNYIKMIWGIGFKFD